MSTLPNAVISIGAGVSQMPVIEEIKKQGYAVIAVDKDESAPGFSYADEKVFKSTHDTEAVVMALNQLNKSYTFKGVVARTTGNALYTASKVSREFNLTGLTEEMVSIATEKSKLRALCEEKNISVARGKKIEECKDSRGLDLKFPLIVKPDFTIEGKKAITLVREERSFKQAFEASKKASGNGTVEVEEYIDGFDVSCLFLLDKGKAQVVVCWDELVGIDAEGSIMGLGASVPSVVENTWVKHEIENIISGFSSEFHDVYALLILSFRIDMNGNPYIIELHADLGGDDIADKLLPMANREFNFFALALSVAVGEEIELSHYPLLFQSTALIYGKSPEILHGNKECLKREISDITDRDLCLIPPRHFEWNKQ